ncbi:MAG: hypothetical protein LPJ86_03240 [Caulobacteraceae bacterium]|nr:hypothetical protein [Caulobacteraceae bacterium]
MSRTDTPVKPASAAAEDRRRTAVLVLGMHRSGTSALTQVLALAGCDLPQNVMPGDEHNAKGYFEPWRIAIFNDQRLRAAGSAWDDPFVHPYRSLEPREERRWITRATDIFEEEFGDARRPLMKDPRVTVLAPMWLTAISELGLDVAVVIPVRHPLEVVGSLAKRNGFPPEKSLLLWSAYMLAAEVHTRGVKRAFVSYDRLLSDWRPELDRVDRALDGLLPLRDASVDAAIDGFLTGELRHNSAEGDLASIPLAGPLTARVHETFAATEEVLDVARLDAAAAALAELKAAMGVLVSPVTSDLDAVRGELLEARQLAAYEHGRVQALEQVEAELSASMDALLGED